MPGKLNLAVGPLAEAGLATLDELQVLLGYALEHLLELDLIGC